MDTTPMDDNTTSTLMSTIELISTTLDTSQDSWNDHLQAIRNITSILEFSDTVPDDRRKQWQLPLLTVFQRVAYADADSGGVPDIGDWCLKQAVTLAQVYPDDVELIALIGRNWLLRAQRLLAKIHISEQSSTSSGGSLLASVSSSQEEKQTARATAEAESRLHTADYVEARGVLLPAVEYLRRAVEASRAQEKVTGDLLATASEAFMSLGNVTSARMNGQYFQQALRYLRDASEMPGYALPLHLANYLEEYGSLAETLK